MINQSQLPDPVSYGVVATVSPVPDRWLLVVRGMAQIIVEDQQGRYIGPNRDRDYPNLLENQIPGASYTPGQVFSSVFLNQPGIYTFTLVGQAPNNVHVFLNLYNGGGKFCTFFFHGVPMTARSKARLVYNTTDQSIIPILALHRDGNGEIEQIQPTILSSQASEDIIPPTTQIYINDNNVTVSATDNQGGSGVWRTYYTTDGITRVIYSEPFPLPVDAKVLMAYSEDRAGNLEYPGAVRPILGISDNHAIMRVKTGTQEIMPFFVDVINLDPTSITAPLEWTASTDVPWLSVEPSGGMTPCTIKLSVHSTDLAPGSREVQVIVRSLTPGTVFASRRLYVVIDNS